MSPPFLDGFLGSCFLDLPESFPPARLWFLLRSSISVASMIGDSGYPDEASMARVVAMEGLVKLGRKMEPLG